MALMEIKINKMSEDEKNTKVNDILLSSFFRLPLVMVMSEGELDIQSSPQEQIRSHKLYVAPSEKVLARIGKDFKFEDCENLHDLEQMLFNKTLDFIKPFVPESQFDTIKYLCSNSDEQNYFREQVKKIANHILEMPLIGEKEEDYAYLHYFVGGTDVWVKEIDVENGEYFGFTCLNNDWEMAEYGYGSLNELKYASHLELDLHFEPKDKLLSNIIKESKEEYYGQNNKRGRGSYGNEGNEGEIRDERESIEEDRHGEVSVSRDVFLENESSLHAVSDGQLAGGRGHSDQLSSGGMGQVDIPRDSGGRYDSETEGRKDHVSFGTGISSASQDNDSTAGGRDGDVVDTNRGRGISDNNADRIGGRHRDNILQTYSPEHIREITRDRNEHLTKGEIKKIRANCAEILKKNESEITDADKKILATYEGAGGLGEDSLHGTHEILSEYYTPQRVIDFAWAVVDRYSAEGYIRKIKEVLEPSCGTGRFAKNRDEHFNMFEIDPVSSKIAKLLYPEADIRHEPFQKQYIVDGTYSLKPEFQARDGISSIKGIDLVIGNPPYGAYIGRYKGIGEGKECLTYPEYFIKRGIDNLQNGGMLCFVIPAGFLASSGVSAAKEYIAEFAELVNAYRLPNNTFSTTNIATDVVFFRANKAKDKNEIEKRLLDITDDNFFTRNPGNIFGIMSRSSHRNMIEVVNGNWQDRKTTGDHMQETLLNLFKEDVDENILYPCGKTELNFTDEEREKQREENSRKKIEEHNKQIALKAKKKIKNKTTELGKIAKVDLMSDVAFNAKYGKDYNPQFKEIWKNVKYDGSFLESDLSDNAKEFLKNSDEFVLFDERERRYFPKTLFTTGNIYQKLDELEKRFSENLISKEVYDNCKVMLEKAKPKQIPFEKLLIKPNSTISSEFMVTRTFLERNYRTDELTEEKDEINLKEDFLFWAGGADRFALEYEYNASVSLKESYSRVTKSDIGENISWHDIVDYLNGVPVREETISPTVRERMTEEEYNKAKEANEQEASLKRAERMESANRLFERYLNDKEWFKEDDRKALTEYYNKIHNAVVSPDFTKIPIFLENMNRFKGEKEFTLHDAQLRGISFLTQKGKGLLAYEVGVGKTSAGICATVLQIQSGRAKRPLIIVPKPVYPKWIKDIHEHFPEIKINALGNMSEDIIEPYRNPVDFRKLDIEEGSITVITYQALENYITFDDKTLEELKEEYGYIYGGDSGNRRSDALTNDKITEYIAKINGKKDDKSVYFDLCEFDHITVDEAHNFKNLVSKPNAGNERKRSNDYQDINVTKPSMRARNLFAITQYVQKNNNDRNVFFLTATPFTNSPLEVYSMLTYLYRKEMIDSHIYNIRDFIEEFIRVKRELVISKEGKVKYAMVVKNWTNLKVLQGLLQNSMDKVTADDANIKRPERMVEKILVEPTELQKEIFEIEAGRMKSAKRNTGMILQAISNKRIATLSPVLLNANRTYDGGISLPEMEKIVEASPKLRITCETIAKNWKAHKDCGQVLYMSFGKEYFELLKNIMVKDYGIDKGAIEIISGKTKEDKRESIQEKFNDPKSPVKILIGSSAIREGIDLNGNSTTLYNLNLDWNPTDLTQSEGRIWRQGNRQGIIHVVYVLENDTSDPIILQKLDEKKTRIDEIWNYNSTVNEIDVSDINPLETKFDLIKDPEAIVDIKIDDMTAEIKAKASILDNNINRLAGMREDLKYTNQRIETSQKPTKWDLNKQSKLYEKLERDYGLVYEKCTDEGFKAKADELQKIRDKYDDEINAILSKKDEMIALEKENIKRREREKFESSEYYNTSDAVFERINSNLKPAEWTQNMQEEDTGIEQERNAEIKTLESENKSSSTTDRTITVQELADVINNAGKGTSNSGSLKDDSMANPTLENQKNPIQKKRQVGAMSLFDYLDESEDESEKREEEIEIKQKKQKKENEAVIQALKTQKEDKALAENWRKAFEEIKSDTVSNIIKGYKPTKPESLYGKKVENSSDMAELLRALRDPNIITHKVISLDKDDRILGIRVFGIGKNNKDCFIDPSLSFINLSNKVKKIYISHNRPDGDVEMSDSDFLFSKQIEKIAREKGLEFKDNIITNGTKFYLYSAHGIKKYHKCDKEAWENVDASLLGYKIEEARDVEVLSAALRQSSPDMKHLIYLTGDNRVCGIHKYHSLEDLKVGLLQTKEIGADKVCCDSLNWKDVLKFSYQFGIKTGIIMDGYGNALTEENSEYYRDYIKALREKAVDFDEKSQNEQGHLAGTIINSEIKDGKGEYILRLFEKTVEGKNVDVVLVSDTIREQLDGQSVFISGKWVEDDSEKVYMKIDRIASINKDIKTKAVGEKVLLSGMVSKMGEYIRTNVQKGLSLNITNENGSYNIKTEDENMIKSIYANIKAGSPIGVFGEKVEGEFHGNKYSFVWMDRLITLKSADYVQGKIERKHKKIETEAVYANTQNIHKPV